MPLENSANGSDPHFGVTLAKRLRIVVVGYVFLGLGFFVISSVFCSPAYMETVLQHELRSALQAQYPIPVDPEALPLSVQAVEMVGTLSETHIPTDFLGTQSGDGHATLQDWSGMPDDISTWWGPARENIITYSALATLRITIMGYGVLLCLPLFAIAWYAGQYRARVGMRQAEMPRNHYVTFFFWLARLNVFTWITYITVPYALPATVITPIALSIEAVALYGTRRYNIEI